MPHSLGYFHSNPAAVWCRCCLVRVFSFFFSYFHSLFCPPFGLTLNWCGWHVNLLSLSLSISFAQFDSLRSARNVCNNRTCSFECWECKFSSENGERARQFAMYNIQLLDVNFLRYNFMPASDAACINNIVKYWYTIVWRVLESAGGNGAAVNGWKIKLDQFGCVHRPYHIIDAHYCQLPLNSAT